MYIPIILGTSRVGRQSQKVANFMLAEILKANLKSEILDGRDFRIEATDNTGKLPQAKKLAEKIREAAGLIIVSPEYNHSFPGELKMMLDMLYEEYARKPVGLCGVSASPLGGARMIEQLQVVLLALQMVPLGKVLYFPLVQNLFNEKGAPKEAQYYQRAKEFLTELIWYAQALKRPT